MTPKAHHLHMLDVLKDKLSDKCSYDKDTTRAHIQYHQEALDSLKDIPNEKNRTGQLAPHPHNRGYYVCVDCDTAYPILKRFDNTLKEDREGISCNGHFISLCPWCRPDTQPWKNGRGK